MVVTLGGAPGACGVQAPPVWDRFVAPPPGTHLPARLTLFWRSAAAPPPPPPPSSSSSATQPAPAAAAVPQPPQDEARVALRLTVGDLQQLLAALLHAVPLATALSSSSSAAATAGAPAAALLGAGGGVAAAAPVPGGGRGGAGGRWVGSERVQIRHRPLPAEDAAAAGDGGGAPASDFELRWQVSCEVQRGEDASSSVSSQASGGRLGGGGSGGGDSRGGHGEWRVARLRQSHVQSLLHLYDDVSQRLPDLAPVPPPPQALTHALASSAASASPAAAAPLRRGRVAEGLAARMAKGLVRLVALAALAVSVPTALGMRLVGWPNHPISSTPSRADRHAAMHATGAGAGAAAPASLAAAAKPTAEAGGGTGAAAGRARRAGLQPASWPDPDRLTQVRAL